MQFSLIADSFAANLVVTEGESVYDFCWYPYMSATGLLVTFYSSFTYHGYIFFYGYFSSGN